MSYNINITPKLHTNPFKQTNQAAPKVTPHPRIPARSRSLSLPQRPRSPLRRRLPPGLPARRAQAQETRAAVHLPAPGRPRPVPRARLSSLRPTSQNLRHGSRRPCVCFRFRAPAPAVRGCNTRRAPASKGNGDRAVSREARGSGARGAREGGTRGVREPVPDCGARATLRALLTWFRVHVSVNVQEQQRPAGSRREAGAGA